MTGLGPDLDAARARLVERGLTAEAVGSLTPVVTGVSLEALASVKQLLKRFFSSSPWTEDDDESLADAVGEGEGTGRHELEAGLTLAWGWERGRFWLRIESDDAPTRRAIDDVGTERTAANDADLARTFEGVVVPEATPSPRTIRFATPPLHAGPGRTYDSAAASDPRVARIFRDFDDVTNVLVGPDFVAVTIARPNRWEALLAPVLRAVTEEFTGDAAVEEPGLEPPAPTGLDTSLAEEHERGRRGLERAWSDLGALRADRPEDLDRVLAAARDSEPAWRQVAAALLVDAPPEAAAREWQRLLGDPSRTVRRAVVDAVAGTGGEELRPLLERALEDADPWTRWKALHGIVGLGLGSSRAAVTSRATDPDFRVRLEAARLIADDAGSAIS